MTTFEFGSFTKEKAQRIYDSLNGKTYMNFIVNWGIMPGGCPVTVSTRYDCSEKEIAEMVMFTLASSL